MGKSLLTESLRGLRASRKGGVGKKRAGPLSMEVWVEKCWWARNPDPGSEWDTGASCWIWKEDSRTMYASHCNEDMYIRVSWVQSRRKGNQSFPVKGDTQSRVAGVCCEPDSLFWIPSRKLALLLSELLNSSRSSSFSFFKMAVRTLTPEL